MTMTCNSIKLLTQLVERKKQNRIESGCWMDCQRDRTRRCRRSSWFVCARICVISFNQYCYDVLSPMLWHLCFVIWLFDVIVTNKKCYVRGSACDLIPTRGQLTILNFSKNYISWRQLIQNLKRHVPTKQKNCKAWRISWSQVVIRLFAHPLMTKMLQLCDNKVNLQVRLKWS